LRIANASRSINSPFSPRSPSPPPASVRQRAFRGGDRGTFGGGAVAAKTHQELGDVGFAVTHDRHVGQPTEVRDLADGRFAGAVAGLEEDLHLGPAREVDAEAHSLDRNRDQSREQHRTGDRRADVALPDEVDMGPGRDDFEGHVFLPA
jgi:hypothetical protein